MPTLFPNHSMPGCGSSRSSLVFAYYVTGHGFDHSTRVVEVVRHLISSGHRVHVVTAAPEFVFTSEIDSRKLFIRKVLLDFGLVQADALAIDRRASMHKYYETAVEHRDSILATEVQWLKSIKANLVVSDAVPIACRAAANAGIRAVCVTHASWDFIYAKYMFGAGHDHRDIVWEIAEDYSRSEFLLRLPGYCPMPAFNDVIDIPLVVRPLRKTREEVRRELGVPQDVKLLIFNFADQPSGLSLKEEYLPAGWLCLVRGASAKDELPSNFIALSNDAYTPDVIAASDCILGTLGYGTTSEALAYKIRFIFVRRDYSWEDPFLLKMLEDYEGGIEMIRTDLLAGSWTTYLERAVTLQPCFNGGIDGGQVAAKILQETARGKKRSKVNLNGAKRLRDSIILEWSHVAGNEVRISKVDQTQKSEVRIPLVDQTQKSSKFVEGFQILHGDHSGLSDTIEFLDSLDTLAKLEGNRQERKHLAAASAIFNWEEDIFVARAPGRLDVMGGIADYSGSLVLLMPTREACHAAVQRNLPSKQKTWKHAKARHHSINTPILEIVSFGPRLMSFRGPPFYMDLSDFIEDDGKPISYEKACHYFNRDPDKKWVSYIAGTVLVLMREMEIRFEDSISILVSSDVPEGKGVSSSASVEVATMSALAAAYGLEISPRDVALLCQKVENYVVGAPCGVMDQIASACGEANKLLAITCQPAEILGVVEIPSHIRFWGIDSGLRHSVGGSDYGSVRIGAFIGKTMIRSIASYSTEATTKVRSELIVNDDASLDYLCNVSPHRFETHYASKLPLTFKGEEFIEKYGDHGDTVTTIDRKCTYNVVAPTKHAVYENFRVQAFKALLTATPSEEQIIALGELMYQCHESYGACGLGSYGTDKLVRLVQNIEKSKHSKTEDFALYGAKITGGGSGGTVCVIGSNSETNTEQIHNIAHTYNESTGLLPHVFEGSSPGAGQFGYLKIHKNSSPLSSSSSSCSSSST